MITMYDGIYVGNVPAGAAAYAGYTSGSWPDYATIKAKYPYAHVLSIAVYAGGPGDCLDVEPGDATNTQAESARAYKVYYTSAAFAAQMVADLAQGGKPRSSYRLWIAHYTGTPHICGPNSCRYPGVPQADGTQYASNNFYDSSLLADDFFGTPSTSEDDDMTPGVATWTDAKGNSSVYHVVRGSDGIVYYMGPDTNSTWVAVDVNSHCQSGVSIAIDPKGTVHVDYVNASGTPCEYTRPAGGGAWTWESLGGSV